ncbi:MAG: hypothetical protein HQL79_02450 [Magnetococcales bacterium]|nr:hypothetical protein [Magnetococcales bacterium]
MIPLQIIIKKDSYAIARTHDEQELVSDIHRMEDALNIFRELTMPEHLAAPADGDGFPWQVMPGKLSCH